MASSPIDTPLVAEFFERARPQFKRHPFKSIEDDLNGSFSIIPKQIMDEFRNPKWKYAQLQRKGFT